MELGEFSVDQLNGNTFADISARCSRGLKGSCNQPLTTNAQSITVAVVALTTCVLKTVMP